LSLRRKRQITAPNTSRAKGAKLLGCALALVGCWSLTATAANPFPEDNGNTYRDQGGAVPTFKAPAVNKPAPTNGSPSYHLKWRSVTPNATAADVPAVKPATHESPVEVSRREPAKPVEVTGPALIAPQATAGATPLVKPKSVVVTFAAAAAEEVVDEPQNCDAPKELPKSSRREPTLAKVEQAPALVAQPHSVLVKPGRSIAVKPVAMEEDESETPNRVMRVIGTETVPTTARTVRVKSNFDEQSAVEPSFAAPKFAPPDDAPAPTPKSLPMPLPMPGTKAAPSTVNTLQPDSSATQPLGGERCPPGEPCRDVNGECQTVDRALRKLPLNNISLNIAVKGQMGVDYPCECPRVPETFVPRNWSCVTYTWKASGVCYHPLWFEEPELERYGHNHGHFIQPFVSGAYFFGNIFLIPYHWGLEPIHECVYPLGYYRPGDCAPRMCPAVPLSLRGGLAEAGVATALIFIVP